MARLLTAQQVAEEFGLPGARTVRTLMSQGMPAYKISKAYLFKVEDVEAFIESRKVVQCQGPTEAPPSYGSPSAASSTSNGTNAGAVKFDRPAQATAKRLKSLSRPSSTKATDAKAGRVIRVKFQ